MAREIKRIFLGQVSEKSPISVPSLVSVQQESFQRIIDGSLNEVLSSISPITDYTGENYSLEIGELVFGDPKYTPSEAIEKGANYEASMLTKVKLTDLQTGKTQNQDVYLGELPLMTERGTFIINGNERTVVNQLTRSPGVYFEASFDQKLKRKIYQAEIRPERGAWIGFEASRDDSLWVRINRGGRKIPATCFLKAFGVSQNEILELFSLADADPTRPFIKNTLAKDSTLNQEEAYLDIYGKMRPGDPRIVENAKSLFEVLFLDQRRFSLGEVGRYKINKRLSLGEFANVETRKQEETRKGFAKTDYAEEKTDYAESSSYLLSKEDLIATVRELIYLSLSQEEEDDIDHLANRRVRTVADLVTDAFRIGLIRLERNIKERLSTTSSEKKITPRTLINARPITAALNQFFGSSQLSQFMHQDNPLQELSHLRTVTAVGPGGLTRERAGVAVRDVQSSHYGKVDAFQTPEGPNIGLNLVLAIYARINKYGFLEAPYRKVIKKGEESFVTEEIIYLPPDDEEQKKIAEATIEINKQGKILEERVAVRYQGDFLFVPKNEVDLVDAHPSQMVGVSSGLIPFLSSDAGPRALIGGNMLGQAVPLIKPEASFVGTGLEKETIRDSGRVLFAKNKGVVDFVDGEKIEIKTKEGLEKYYLTKFKRSNSDTCYNQTPRVKKGDKVKKGQALVDGPSSEAGELALGRDLLIAFMPWGGYTYEDSIVVSQRLIKEDLLTSINIKEYSAEVMDTKLGAEEITRDIPNVSEEALRNLDEDGIVVIGAEVSPGDILVGKIAPKGETELTAEERLLRAIFGEKAREIRDTSLIVPHGDRGTVIAVEILDKARGDELGPGVLRSIRVKVAEKRKLKVGDKIAGRHGSKGVIAKIVPEEDMPYMADGTPIDIIVDPISILGRMNVGQILETHLGWAAHALDEYYAVPAFDKLEEDIISKKLKAARLPADGKITLYDGYTGEPFAGKIAVGFAHIMKLTHMVEDKVHARSTGPYNLITQQPLGGKAQMGGQRLGEMEVWALEAYGAAHTLQEMLTIKSDDVIGRNKAVEAIIRNEPIPEPRVPEAFKLLTKELNSLGLAVDTVKFEKEEKQKE
ncbi:MAG: DNA-directed RNA polymerase subunit beta [Candidatus Cloacimonetes bacterium]|nr:DNA-directed RNA polymerase subunit beta [Candidatus Cloacimonadota bacterium]